MNDTAKVVKKRKKRKSKEKLQKLEFLQNYFSKNQKELNKFDGNAWCHKASCLFILGVCLYRKLKLSKMIIYRNCKKCFEYLEEYVAIFDYLENKEIPFFELLVQGKTSMDKINTFLERWKLKYSNIIKAHSYLGLDEKEYNLWIKKPELLEQIIGLKKKDDKEGFDELYKINNKIKYRRRKA